MYAKRVVTAHQRRIQAVQAMRYHLCVDSMPVDDIQALTVEQINRILSAALNSKTLRVTLSLTSCLTLCLSKRWYSIYKAPIRNLPTVCCSQERLSETHELANEAITDYARTMNRILFDKSAKAGSSGVSGLSMIPLNSSAVQKEELHKVYHVCQIRQHQQQQ